MKTIEPYKGFEQGPIRPPSEADSLLLRITRNCPWNHCTFCPVYKGTRFSLRPVEHIIKDIDLIGQYVESMLVSKDKFGKVMIGNIPSYVDHSLTNHEEIHEQALYAGYNFITNNMHSIFLQDGNSLILPPEDLVRILDHIRQVFPHVDRITSYARSHTIARISDNDLARYAAAGLNRIHIGMESGSDIVLKNVRKGTDKATQILAGQKIKRAGIELSEYYMPGLGGKALSRENALETADALNQINPDFIRLRTLALPENTPIADDFQEGKFDKMDDIETAKELLTFIDSLDGITSRVKSDHTLNLFPEIDGVLPQDKEKLMAPLKTYLNLPKEEQMLFSISRRTHTFSRLEDLTNPTKRAYARKVFNELEVTEESFDKIIDNIMKQFI
ncbi:MAG: radical SAM protein [Desulfovibrio sp.]